MNEQGCVILASSSAHIVILFNWSHLSKVLGSSGKNSIRMFYVSCLFIICSDEHEYEVMRDFFACAESLYNS